MQQPASPLHVAVLGASGLVGQEMISVLHERKFPVRQLSPVASIRSAGSSVSFGNQMIQIVDATTMDWQGVDLVLMSAGSQTAQTYGPKAAQAGAVIIDNSSCFRMDEDVPLVVPEINPQALSHIPRKLIANPNCATIQLAVALAPLLQEVELEFVHVATYQAVSGAGQAGIEELGDQVQALLRSQEVASHTFAKQIAFNCIPHIDQFLPDGETKEERKMRQELRKILTLPNLQVATTCVRVPIFHGHSLAVVLRCKQPMPRERAQAILRQAPGVCLLDEPNHAEYPTTLDAIGTDSTYVGRIRNIDHDLHTLALWIVADNVRKGAATNAVQIAEILLRDYRHHLSNVSPAVGIN